MFFFNHHLLIVVKEVYSERGIKDQDHELVRKAFEKEYEKVMRQLNITKIIHDTYVKEIARHYKKQEDERRKREESEERRLREAGLAMQQELAAKEEERAKNERLAKRAARR